MIKILITGGCGFLGTNFIFHLLNQCRTSKIKILNIDIVSYYSNTYLTESIGNTYFFQKIDITSYKSVGKVLREFLPNIVINFAAQTHVDRSFYDSMDFVRTNILGVQNLFELSRRYKVEKFIHISTDEVFGEVGNDKPPTESSKNFNPTNPYSASKASAEILLFALVKSFSYPAVIVRTNNNYGPFQFPEKLIPLSILFLIKNYKVPIYGDGKQRRRWLYVEDFCNGLSKIVFSKVDSEVYHFGTDIELENIEVVKSISKLLKKGEDCIRFIKDRPSHDRCYALDFEETKKILKWHPRTSFERGLNRTVKWYLNNIEWLEKIVKSHSYVKFIKKHYNIDIK